MAQEVIELTTEFVYEEEASPCDKVDIQELGRHLLPILYSIVFFIGLVGNLLVVTVILKGGNRRNITDIFFLNLAISDLFFVISLPFWASYLINGWTLGNLSCKVVSSFYSVGFFGGMLFITVISIDRYLAIVRATFCMRTRTARNGFFISLLLWLVAVLFATPQFVFAEKLGATCTSQYPEIVKKTWPVFSYMELNILGFLFPLSIMSCCYFGIIKTLLSCKNNRKKRAIRLILLVVVVFILFWTPYNISIFLQFLKHYDFFQNCNALRIIDYTTHVTETVAFSHCCLNPIIYAFAGEKFRKYLSKIILKCLSFICFCGPCSQYHGQIPTPIPDTAMTSNPTQNTSDQDCSLLL